MNSKNKDNADKSENSDLLCSSDFGPLRTKIVTDFLEPFLPVVLFSLVLSYDFNFHLQEQHLDVLGSLCWYTNQVWIVYNRLEKESWYLYLVDPFSKQETKLIRRGEGGKSSTTVGYVHVGPIIKCLALILSEICMKNVPLLGIPPSGLSMKKKSIAHSTIAILYSNVILFYMLPQKKLYIGKKIVPLLIGIHCF